MSSARQRNAIFRYADPASIFTRIYETKWWGGGESASGTGSTIAYTERLRAELPKLLKEFGIASVFDAPCGDFHWMRLVIESTDIDYLGGDIVPQLIRRNSEGLNVHRARFIVTNIISDDFPQADLWICRDCLIHFSFKDILATLENFSRSEINYLLTTTHLNHSGFLNTDIRTGDARLIDLFSPPFNLPLDCEVRIVDWLPPDVPREMVLFSRQQIIDALPGMRAAIGNAL